MGSGIYALYWWEQDLIYVGLTTDLTRRKQQHFRKLAVVSNKHCNWKLQQAFNNYGYPDFIVLETAPIRVLDDLEKAWGEELEVMGPNGLNIQEPGIGPGYGPLHNTSKYSKIQILKVFSLLYKGCTTVPEISNRTKVSITNIHNISNGDIHTWLKQDYPEQYEKMTLVDRVALGYNMKKPKALLLGPDNKEYIIFSLNSFCREYFGSIANAGNLSKLIKGECTSRYGFKLITRY